jgi:Rieske Fe-S protein
MNIDELGIPRRHAIATAGLALGAAAIAACTTYGKKPAAPPATAPAEATSPAPGTAAPVANAIAKTTDVPVGSGVIVDEIVVTQPSAGEFKGLSAICTHAGCTVSEVVDGTINCPCHGSKFNLDGSVANGPATRPLDAQAISVQGDSIVLG